MFAVTFPSNRICDKSHKTILQKSDYDYKSYTNDAAQRGAFLALGRTAQRVRRKKAKPEKRPEKRADSPPSIAHRVGRMA